MLASAPSGPGGMVGAAGLEPADGGSKGRCLTSLATPQESAARRDRRPAWRPPNGGRSDYPDFAELRDPGPDRRAESRAGEGARRRRGSAKTPKSVGPLPDRPTARAPSARSRSRSGAIAGHRRCAAGPRGRWRDRGPAPASMAAGSRSGRGVPGREHGRRSRAATPGFTSRHASGAKPASGSIRSPIPVTRARPRGEEEGHVGAERERERGESLRRERVRKARRQGAQHRARVARAAAQPGRHGNPLGQPDPDSRARARPRRESPRGPHRQIGRVRGHAGRRARERELDLRSRAAPAISSSISSARSSGAKTLSSSW